MQTSYQPHGEVVSDGVVQYPAETLTSQWTNSFSASISISTPAEVAKLEGAINREVVKSVSLAYPARKYTPPAGNRGNIIRNKIVRTVQTVWNCPALSNPVVNVKTSNAMGFQDEAWKAPVTSVVNITYTEAYTKTCRAEGTAQCYPNVPGEEWQKNETRQINLPSPCTTAKMVPKPAVKWYIDERPNYKDYRWYRYVDIVFTTATGVSCNFGPYVNQDYGNGDLNWTETISNYHLNGTWTGRVTVTGLTKRTNSSLTVKYNVGTWVQTCCIQ